MFVNMNLTQDNTDERPRGDTCFLLEFVMVTLHCITLHYIPVCFSVQCSLHRRHEDRCTVKFRIKLSMCVGQI